MFIFITFKSNMILQKWKILPSVLMFFILPGVNGQLYTIIGDVATAAINLLRLSVFLLPRYPDSLSGVADNYDFIIIGAGPSGSVVANRLTENPNVRVLLLENGPEPSFYTDIPAVAGTLGPTEYNYGYRTEPQKGFCKECQDKNVGFLHGDVLGGTSIINYMLYMRGNRRDYDKWASLGNPGWSFADLLPLFKKSEDCRVAVTDPGYRGTGGPLTVSDVKFNTKITDVFIEACKEVGYKYVDYNGKEQLGVSRIQATTRNGKRCSAEKAFLEPAKNRPNLTIKTMSKVTKILIDPLTKIAKGVQYFHDGIFHAVFASKEVILSAGVLNSPQLLMISGVGPRHQLEPLGIPVIKELPVGQKMYDHVNFPAVMYQVNESITLNFAKEILDPANVAGFAFGQGFFTSTGGVEAVTYTKLNNSDDNDPLYPDVELLMVSGFMGTDYGIWFRKLFNILPEMYDKFYKPLELLPVYQVIPVLLHPKSFGRIEIKSNSAFDAPKFFANFFSDPDNDDIKTMIGAIREFQKINNAPALRRYGSKIVSTPLPGCEQETFDSDSYWECALRAICGTFWHMTTTCKMGPSNDLEAVVDNELRVYGIKHLRVVDTSVIPFPLSSHNVAPAYVIGEKGAQLLKQFYGI